jgi:CRP/FNR family cyclic AMP-dependent transcriptional regulator
MNGLSSISLLELEPDLAGVLSDEQRGEAERFLLPVAALDKGSDIGGVFEESGAFGAIVLEGMLIQALQIGENPTLGLIGPGSFVPPTNTSRSMPVVGARLFVPVPTRLVLLGEQVRIAARQWPWIVSRLHARMLEHSEGLATQLAICQLPRVEDRLMALMWLLAEVWGRVTPSANIRLASRSGQNRQRHRVAELDPWTAPSSPIRSQSRHRGSGRRRLATPLDDNDRESW